MFILGLKAAAASSIHNDGPPCVMRHIIQQDNRVDNAINGLSTIIMILIYYINPKKVALIMQFHPLEISFLLKHTSYLNVNTSIQNPKSQSIKAKYLISSFHGHWWKMPNLDLKKVEKPLNYNRTLMLHQLKRTIWIIYFLANLKIRSLMQNVTRRYSDDDARASIICSSK